MGLKKGTTEARDARCWQKSRFPDFSTSCWWALTAAGRLPCARVVYPTRPRNHRHRRQPADSGGSVARRRGSAAGRRQGHASGPEDPRARRAGEGLVASDTAGSFSQLNGVSRRHCRAHALGNFCGQAHALSLVLRPGGTQGVFNRTRDWADLEAIVEAGTLDLTRTQATLIQYLGADDARIGKLAELTAC